MTRSKEQSLVFASTMQEPTEGATKFFSIDGVAVQDKVFVFGAIFVGDCMVDAGGRLIIRSDGTANWVARARSSDSNDTLSMYFLFLNRDGAPTFPTGIPWFPNTPFPVSPLNMPNSHTWYDWVSGFGFPAGSFAAIESAGFVISG